LFSRAVGSDADADAGSGAGVIPVAMIGSPSSFGADEVILARRLAARASVLRISLAGGGSAALISRRSRRLNALQAPDNRAISFPHSVKNSWHHGRIFVSVRSKRVGFTKPASSRSRFCEMTNWCGMWRLSFRLLVPKTTSTAKCPDKGSLRTRRMRPGRGFGPGLDSNDSGKRHQTMSRAFGAVLAG